MAVIDRRALLRDFLPGAAVAAAGVATVGFSFMPDAAEAMPLAISKDAVPKIDDMVETAQVVVVGPGPRRRWRRRGRRRWVCWWSRGRRVCGWRWW